MKKQDSAGLIEFKSMMRKMFFTNDVIDEIYSEYDSEKLEIITSIIHMELETRASRKRTRLLNRAKFPALKSFDGYDFNNVAFPEGFTAKDLMSLEFVSRAEDFVFHGPTGRGKTHLAIAIGAACANAGKRVRFFGTADLVLQLKKANEEGILTNFMKDIASSELIILDELGYVPLDVEGARLLFQVMSSCYETRSLIITTNIEFGKWGTIFADDKLAAAIIDRLVHHGRLVEFNGGSYRMSSALMLDDKKAKN